MKVQKDYQDEKHPKEVVPPTPDAAGAGQQPPTNAATSQQDQEHEHEQKQKQTSPKQDVETQKGGKENLENKCDQQLQHQEQDQDQEQEQEQQQSDK